MLSKIGVLTVIFCSLASLAQAETIQCRVESVEAFEAKVHIHVSVCRPFPDEPFRDGIERVNLIQVHQSKFFHFALSLALDAKNTGKAAIFHFDGTFSDETIKVDKIGGFLSLFDPYQIKVN